MVKGINARTVSPSTTACEARLCKTPMVARRSDDHGHDRTNEHPQKAVLPQLGHPTDKEGIIRQRFQYLRHGVQPDEEDSKAKNHLPQILSCFRRPKKRMKLVRNRVSNIPILKAINCAVMVVPILAPIIIPIAWVNVIRRH